MCVGYLQLALKKLGVPDNTLKLVSKYDVL